MFTVIRSGLKIRSSPSASRWKTLQLIDNAGKLWNAFNAVHAGSHPFTATKPQLFKNRNFFDMTVKQLAADYIERHAIPQQEAVEPEE